MNAPMAYAALLALGAVLCLAIGILAWRHRPTPGATSLAGLAGGAVIWSLATFAQVVAEGYAPSLLWGRVVYLGIVLTGTSWFVLALEYAGKERYLQPRYLAILAVEPILVNGLVWTNSLHGLVWQSASPGGSIYGFTLTYGPVFWAHAAYSYTLLAAGSLLILGQLYQQRSIFRGQAVAMFVGALAPWIGNLLWLVGVTTLDWTPIAFVVSCLALFWAISSRDLIDVAPIARDAVLDRIPSGVAVIDTRNRVLDFNEEMERLLAAESDELVGSDAVTAFAAWPSFRATVAENAEGTYQVTRGEGDDQRYFDVEIVPLIDDLDRRIGRILLVHDVTDQRRRQQELERKNEQLDRFAEVLSHDLRNPLSVASGRAELLAETGDLDHVEGIQRAHERMEEIVEDVRHLLKQGTSTVDREPVAVEDVARTAAENVDTRAASIEIEPIGVVAADRRRLQRALENLLRNAVDHGGDDVTVTIGRIAGTRDRGVDGFFVEDDGPGIPEADRERVFEHGHTTSEDGTGFGLSIVARAADAHGWDVDVTAADGGGARFEITGVHFVADEAEAETPVDSS